ncbi:hypothetical protein [Chlamydia sp. 17-3921]|uniref:hypothetical protein n=1 Tax=Chlamydia sp. 17-3921 TaxID=2675798 RepID=UPI001919044B|nr:hypothetical protein [Chlamydia sp. 17-3921]
MMSSKRISQLALLSIFLTFSHDVGYASSRSTIGLHTSCIHPTDSKKINKTFGEKKKHKLRQKRIASSKKTDGYAHKKVFNPSAIIKNFSKPRIYVAKNEKRTSQREKIMDRKSTVSLFQELADEFCSGKEASTVSSKKKFATRPESSLNLSQTLVKTSEVDSRKFCVAPQEISDSKESSQIAIQNNINDDECFEEKVIVHNKIEDTPLRELAKGAALPILVRPDPTVVEQAQKTRLLEELTKERRSSRRKSARQVLESQENTKIVRDGSVTSTLRYNVEKAVSIKEKRNASVHPQIRAQKSSYSRREKKAEAAVAAKGEKSSNVSQSEVSKQKTSKKDQQPTNYYKTALGGGNTNIESYLDAKQHRCDSSETDWPCSSCISKRRAHTSISVCTMVVTVIAMIIGALIISSATDDPRVPATPTTPTGTTGTVSTAVS